MVAPKTKSARKPGTSTNDKAKSSGKSKPALKICLLVVGAIALSALSLAVGIAIGQNNQRDTVPYYDPSDPFLEGMKKPVIYLYPEQPTELTLKLGHPENLTASYPTYPQTGWHVLAQPNGDLSYLPTGRELYSLYYESQTLKPYRVEDEGFVVASTDMPDFLEEKLAYLGLNEREAEEFIIYWLPKLQAHPYSYIRFADAAEIEQNMPLQLSQTPDTSIRILMSFKPLDAPINVREQLLQPAPARNGFTLVEWGAIEIR